MSYIEKKCVVLTDGLEVSFSIYIYMHSLDLVVKFQGNYKRLFRILCSLNIPGVDSNQAKI